MASSYDEKWHQNWADGTAKALSDLSSWMHRRRETVSFSGPSSVNRHVEVEFDVPLPLQQAAAGFDPPWVLLGFLPAGVTSPLVVDELGARVPVLTASQASRLALGALARMAPGGPSDLPSAALAAFVQSSSEALVRDLAVRIGHDIFLRALLTAVERTYPLFAQVELRDRKRRVFTYEYDHTLDRTPVRPAMSGPR
jgi:hypothetical protein